MSRLNVDRRQLRRRAAARVLFDFEAFLRVGDGPERSTQVRDFSSLGFQCVSFDTLPVGSPATLRLPGHGEFPATIAWQLGVKAGGRFEPPLPMQIVMTILLDLLETDIDEDVPARPGARPAGARPTPGSVRRVDRRRPSSRIASCRKR